MTDVINTQNAGDLECNDTRISVSSENHVGTAVHLILYNGNRAYTIPAAFYNDVLNTVSEVIHLLVPGEIYTVEIIYGKALWGPLTDGERRMAGRCLAHMVANDRLPQLRFVGCPHEHPKKYQLR